MTDRDDGGPVFPCPGFPEYWSIMRGKDGQDEVRQRREIPSSGGVSLRDWLAGMALQGLLSNAAIAKGAANGKVTPEHNQRWHADTAYQFADAMLKARNERQE